MAQKLELYDFDNGTFAAKVTQDCNFVALDKLDFAGWLFEEKLVGHWCDINGVAHVEHHHAAHMPVPVEAWLRAEPTKDEIVIRYLDSLGHFPASLALAAAQAEAERPAPTFTPDEERQMLDEWYDHDHEIRTI